MRLSQIAITVADNAGRARTGIDELNIHEVFSGANFSSAIRFRLRKMGGSFYLLLSPTVRKVRMRGKRSIGRDVWEP